MTKRENHFSANLPLDNDGLLCGHALDDLDITPDEDFALPYPSADPRSSRSWWQTSELEAFHYGFPAFASLADRAHHIVGQMCRAVSNDDDERLFEFRGEMVSAREFRQAMADLELRAHNHL